MTVSRPSGSGQVDFALLRFLRAGRQETGVLNGGRAAPCGEDLSERLVAAALQRGASTGDADALAAVAAELQRFDPVTLGSRAQRLAFWINVYNALVIDAVQTFGVQSSIREVPGFFHRAAYRISGQRYTLAEIEHGVLRGNRPMLPAFSAPFPVNDPRLASVIAPADPRVHFALHCATRSCPLLRPYHAATIDADLDAATMDYLLAGVVECAAGGVRLAAIFDLYRDDFGDDDGVRAFVLAHLPASPLRDAVRRAFADGQVCYESYDWSLAGG